MSCCLLTAANLRRPMLRCSLFSGDFANSVLVRYLSQASRDLFRVPSTVLLECRSRTAAHKSVLSFSRPMLN